MVVVIPLQTNQKARKWPPSLTGMLAHPCVSILFLLLSLRPLCVPHLSHLSGWSLLTYRSGSALWARSRRVSNVISVLSSPLPPQPTLELPSQPWPRGKARTLLLGGVGVLGP